MQGNIEKLQREYDFVSKLSPDDVAYIIEKKKEAAALKIQRAFRYRQAAKKRALLKKEMKENMGINSDDRHLLEAYITPEIYA